MNRPEDIPERVWAEATNEALAYIRWLGPVSLDSDAEHVLAVSIARAILAAENRMWEECVADARQAWLDGIPAAEIWLAVRARGAIRAAAIRKGGEDA